VAVRSGLDDTTAVRTTLPLSYPADRTVVPLIGCTPVVVAIRLLSPLFAEKSAVFDGQAAGIRIMVTFEIRRCMESGISNRPFSTVTAAFDSESDLQLRVHLDHLYGRFYRHSTVCSPDFGFPGLDSLDGPILGSVESSLFVACHGRYSVQTGSLVQGSSRLVCQPPITARYTVYLCGIRNIVRRRVFYSVTGGHDFFRESLSNPIVIDILVHK